MRFLLQLEFYQLMFAWAWQYAYGPHQQIKIKASEVDKALKLSNLVK